MLSAFGTLTLAGSCASSISLARLSFEELNLKAFLPRYRLMENCWSQPVARIYTFGTWPREIKCVSLTPRIHRVIVSLLYRLAIE
jgi:hypothetical protein